MTDGMKRRLKHDRAQPQSGLLIDTNKWANCYYSLAIDRLPLMIATDHSTCIECALILKLLCVISLDYWLFYCTEVISVLMFILTIDNRRECVVSLTVLHVPEALCACTMLIMSCDKSIVCCSSTTVKSFVIILHSIFCVLQEAPFVVLSLVGTVNDSTSFFALSCKYWQFYDLAMSVSMSKVNLYSTFS